MTTNVEPGGALFVEYLVQGRTSWGTRLHADGRSEEWTDAGGWQPLVRVPGPDVASFADLVRRSGFFDLPASIDAEGIEDAPLLSWTIELDGRRHRVDASDPGPALDPILRDLDIELQRIVGEALNREADAGSPG